MDIEGEQVEEVTSEHVSVEDSLRQALTEIEAKEAEVEVAEEEQQEKPARSRDDAGKFAKESEKRAEKAEKPVKAKQEKAPEGQEPVKAKYDPPQSWPDPVKALWAKLPPEVQEYTSKREGDIHKNMTASDGDLRYGRELKEVITPYMPIIQSEGGTPATAVRDLLNTAYQLRTAAPQQKAQIVQQIISAYGVDMGLVQQQQQQPQMDPHIQAIMQRVQGIENTFKEQGSLQERQKFDNIVSEIKAFAAKPENEHFEAVRGNLSTYLSVEEAKNPNRPFQEILQEAYQAAIWADPKTRTALIAKQQEQSDQKRKEEIAKKKKAAVSVTGSPGVRPPASPKSQKSLTDELSEVYDQLMG